MSGAAGEATGPALFEVVPVADCRPQDLVAALSAAFGRDDFTEDWFQWKHLLCPFGPSTGWAALDGEGIVGVRLFTPWRWVTSAGPMEGLRPMDGGVVPRARRRGVFETLVRTEMEVRHQAGSPLIALSTSVPASRAAYVKLGWCPLGVVAHIARPVVPRPARLLAWDPVAPQGPPPGSTPSIATAWTDEALRWRFDERAGYRYGLVQLAQADAPNGLAYRVISGRGLRAVVVEHATGTGPEVGRLLQAVAAASRAPVILSASGPGARPVLPPGRLGRARGASTLTSWSVGLPATLRAEELTTWRLDLADVEGVL